MPLDLAGTCPGQPLDSLPEPGDLVFFHALAQPRDQGFVGNLRTRDDACLDTFARNRLRIVYAEASRFDDRGMGVEIPSASRAKSSSAVAW